MSEMRTKYVCADFGKIVSLRLLPGTDVMNGIKKICEENGIRHGHLLMAIGSLNQLTIQIFRPKPEAKIGAGYTDPEVIPGPIEIVGLSGIIFETEKGEVALHLHGTFTDKEGKVLGGHLVPGGNPICATMDACIAEVSNVKFMVRYDKETELNLFSPEKP